jgi:transcriptional antiterminator NusG
MDEPQTAPDDADVPENISGDEDAAMAASVPAEEQPANEPAEPITSPEAMKSAARLASRMSSSARKEKREDDEEEDEFATEIPTPSKSETFTRAESSGRPNLPSHMTDEDTPRDPETIPMHWYVLKVQSNREKSIRDSLVRRIKREGVQDYFGEIVIPTEKVVETKGGKRKIREQKLFPGYMMIQVRLTDETWFLVRDTSGVGDFTGSAGRPSPMQEHEIARMMGGTETVTGEEEKPNRPVVKFSVVVSDVVKVKEGPFESFEGTVDALDEASGKVKVIIEIFGRPTEVELEHWQVEKA